MDDIYTVLGLVAGVMLSMSFGYFVVAPRARSLICESLGLEKVKTKDGSVFTMLGPDGEPMKVPIGTKEGENGPELVMGVAPLFYTFSCAIADQAALKVKMGLLNTKSQISKQLSKQGLQQAMAEGGGIDQMMPFLPKKAQVAFAALKALGIGSQTAGNGPTAQNSPLGRPRTGGGPL